MRVYIKTASFAEIAMRIVVVILVTHVLVGVTHGIFV